MPNLEFTTDIQYLKGVGPRRGEVLIAHGIDTVGRLLYYFPRKYIDRSQLAPIASLQENDYKTVVGKVLGKGLLKGGRTRLEVIIGDESGHLSLMWFAGYRFFEKQFKKGDEIAVTGTVTYFNGYQMLHPEFEFIGDDADDQIHTGRIVPIYPMTAELNKVGLTSRSMRKLIKTALVAMEGRLSEYLPEEIIDAEKLSQLPEAVYNIHYPADADSAERARRRLAFDELLFVQFLLQQRKLKYKTQEKPHVCHRPGKMFTDVLDQLPFKLTEGQQKSLSQIIDDMTSKQPMNRLLQGDVGSGKTVVAILAAVLTAENGGQAAMMVPTEILAEQHYANWREPLEKAGLITGLLIGSIKGKERKEILTRLESGEINIIFGTHAVISKTVLFADLRLVVIDEQHRFGVMQRSRLAAKGEFPDRLVMTATPIPRTLALTLYGDLDISTIPDMPPGRKPVKTVWRFSSTLGDIYKFVDEEVGKGNQAFIIFPLVEKSEKMDLQAAEDGYQELTEKILPHRKIGLVHGRIKADQRDKVIRTFHDGKLDILVATTVIEVGIDIPRAGILLIQHAERFGLSQLHQMRGRVGRGERQGLAVAVAYHPVSEIGRRRLEYFASTTDGFKIAEADLELRGPGEFFGTRQHGLPEFRLANPITDQEILVSASVWAEKLYKKYADNRQELGFLLNHAAVFSTLRIDLMDVA
ncbi:MAG: ATP-dependent DNA helicase RecG [FCB group bacterium]|nr:ATP-dependent DNA helicase RecG [FCB group bacterium]